MTKRSKLGVLLGAGLLTFALGGTALAATQSITVVVTASPMVVPAGGASVHFTVTVTNTGSGGGNSTDLAQLYVSFAPCSSTLDGTTNLGPLASGDSFVGSCDATVTADTFTASAFACHDSSQAKQCTSGSDDTGVITGSVIVTSPTAAPPTKAPATKAPTFTQPPTDAIGTAGNSGPSDGAWLLVVALGVLLASIVVLAPARAKSRR